MGLMAGLVIQEVMVNQVAWEILVNREILDSLVVMACQEIEDLTVSQVRKEMLVYPEVEDKMVTLGNQEPLEIGEMMGNQAEMEIKVRMVALDYLDNKDSQEVMEEMEKQGSQGNLVH